MTVWDGIEGMTDEDLSYRGSHFSSVLEALFSNPYQRVWGSAGEPPMPIYKVTLYSFLSGMLPLGRSFEFRKAAERTLDSFADLRWGPDRKGFRRLVHPNGICLAGVWKITEATDYSGYFREGSHALIIARYSSCCGETRRGHTRSLSMVGKLYPTVNPDDTEPLRTANFMTQQDNCKLHDAARYWRRLHQLHQRRGVAECPQYNRLAARSRAADLNSHRRSIQSGR